LKKFFSNYKYLFIFIGIVSGVITVSAFSQATSSNLPKVDDYLRSKFEVLGPVPIPVENQPTENKVKLGKMLFYDKRLSGNNQVSCITCHNPDLEFTDGRKIAIGVDNSVGKRNTPTVINTAYFQKLFWDGRASSLEEQALGPIQNPVEMNQNLDDLVKELNEVPEYKKLFSESFNGKISKQHIAEALASFERTLVEKNTPFDQYMNGDDNALTTQEKLGMEIFAGKGNCLTCHAGASFSDNNFDNIGVNNGDLGRFEVTKLAEDKGKFRSPQLRNLKYTAPYMHDGSLKTLEDVVKFYSDGKHVDKFTSEDFQPLNLSDKEQVALVSFLISMSGEPFKIDPPTLP